MIRYLTRKLVIYVADVRRRGDDRLGDPAASCPATRSSGCSSRMQAQPSAAAGADRLLHAGVRLRRAALEAVPQLLGGALPRRPRPLSISSFPTTGLDADPRRAALHARAAHPGDPALASGPGTRSARSPRGGSSLDNTVLPVAYVLTATPQMWLGIVLVWLFASTLAWLPVSGAYGLGLQPEWSVEFAGSFLYALDPPVLRALPRRLRRLGDRDAEHDHLRARGRLLELPGGARRAERSSSASTPTATRCCRRSPGLALALGAVVAGAIVVEIVFSYPGPRHADAVGDPEPRLLPDPGDLPVHDRRRADRELHHRHRLRLHRPAHARRHAGRARDGRLRPRRRAGGRRRRRRRRSAAAGAPAGGASAAAGDTRRSSSTSRCATGSSSSGSTVVLFMLAARDRRAAARPHTRRSPSAARPTRARRRTTGSARPSYGQDVYSQFVNGLRAAFLVGAARRRHRGWLIGDGRRLHRRLSRRLGRRRR